MFLLSLGHIVVPEIVRINDDVALRGPRIECCKTNKHTTAAVDINTYTCVHTYYDSKHVYGVRTKGIPQEANLTRSAFAFQTYTWQSASASTTVLDIIRVRSVDLAQRPQPLDVQLHSMMYLETYLAHKSVLTRSRSLARLNTEQFSMSSTF